jgi:hypothetical protein
MKKIALAHSVPISPEPVGASSDMNSDDSGAADAAISPEIMAVIETAVAAFAGKNARIISVKEIPAISASGRSWASHGLTLIHGSHNLVQRGH